MITYICGTNGIHYREFPKAFWEDVRNIMKDGEEIQPAGQVSIRIELPDELTEVILISIIVYMVVAGVSNMRR